MLGASSYPYHAYIMFLEILLNIHNVSLGGVTCKVMMLAIDPIIVSIMNCVLLLTFNRSEFDTVLRIQNLDLYNPFSVIQK